MNPLGIDVAKAKLDVCLLLEDGHPRTKVVPNTAVGFERLLAWCVKHKALPGQLHAVMESTGGYHEPVARALIEAGMLVNLRQGRFACAEQLAAYLGLVPVERQSGSSVKGKARLSKNGPPEVRAILYMAAVVARKCNPHIRNMAERLAQRGKCKMAILGAAMRKLVHLCFGVLKNQLPYQPLYSQKS